MSKKLLALLLALVMIVGSFTSVLAAEKTATETKPEEKVEEKKAEEKKDEKVEEKKDEKSEEKTEEKKEEKTEEKKEEVKDEALLRAQEVLKKAGIISGYSKDSEDFKAEKNVTRAEFASMIVRALNLEASAKSLATVPTGFKDVPTNLWANGYIAVAKQQGIINGYPNGTFQPNRQISYQDMATMLTIALGKAEVGTVYPAGYIVKAQQLGLFNKVDVPAYTDMATRGNVFKMVYNMVSSKEFGNRKIIKALVIENSRVEKLDKDEVTVEVISVVQKANWAQDKKGDNHTYKLDKELMLDPEELLGKVADFTVDQNDKIVEVKVDDTYKYVEGKVKNVSRNKIKVGGVYTVGMDERYDDTDERIVRTYLNNKAYAYRDFAENYTVNGIGNYDFARITVKNGKVIFIDAYKFDDVAPVTYVKDGDVFYRDDSRNGDEYRASNLSKVVFHSAKGYSVAEVKDIVKDDVIHFYNDYRNAIVRKDAKVETKLVRTYENADGQFVEGKDASYPLNFTKKFRALSSFEGKFFDEVKDRSVLKEIVGDDVKLLLALDNTVQLVETSKAWSEGIHAVKQVISRGEALLLPGTNGEQFWAVETRDTKYMNIDGDNKTTLNQRLFGINADDIVYYAGTDKNDIVKMGIIKTHEKYTREMQLASMDTRYIYYGATPYRYFSGLNAFYVDKDGKDIQRIADIDQFRKDNAKNTKLQAYVMSEKQLRDNLKDHQELKVYNFLSDAKDIAKIVVFKNVNGDPQYEYKYTVVDEKSGWLDQGKFIDAEGKEYVVNLPEDNDIFSRDDIVKLGLDKSTIDKKDVHLAGKVKEVVIHANQKLSTVYRIDRTRRTNTYKVRDLVTDKEIEEVYFDKDTKVFGTPTDYAQIYKDPDKKYSQYVLVIRYLDKDDVDFPGAGKRVVLGLGSRYYSLVLNGEKVDIDDQVLFLKKDGSAYGKGVIGFEQLVQDGYLGGEVLVIRDRLGNIIAVKAVQKATELAKTELAEALDKDAKKLNTTVKLPSGTNNAQADLQTAIQTVLEAQINADSLRVKVSSVTVNSTPDGKFTAVLQHPADATVTKNISGTYTINASQAEDNAEAEAKKAEEAANVFANIPSLINEVEDTSSPKDGKLDENEILTAVKAAIDKELRLNADSPLKGFVESKLTLNAADVKAKVNTPNVFEATFTYNGVKATTAIPFAIKATK